MADQTVPNGQYMPLPRSYSLSNTPSSYATTPRESRSKSYTSQSFEDLFNRAQMSSAQMKSLQSQPNSASSMLSTVPRQTNPLGASGPQKPVFTPSDGTMIDPKQIAETNKNLEKIPTVVPQGDTLANVMLNNMQQYNQAKASWDDKPSQSSVPPTALKPQTQTQPIIQQPDIPSSALHSALAKNQPTTALPSTPVMPAQAGSHQTDPIQAAPSVPSTPVPVHHLPAYIPGDQVLNQINASRNALAAEQHLGIESRQLAQNSIPQSTPNRQLQSLSKPVQTGTQNKGFFSAVSSFFGNLFSGVTLGLYRPKGEPAPQGFDRVVYPFKKLVWDTPKSIVYDMPAGVYHDITKGHKNSSDRMYSQGGERVSRNNRSKASQRRMAFGHVNRKSSRHVYYS